MGKQDATELPQWAKIQKKTFTNWVNVHLADRGLKLADLATDLDDGVKLINLLEIISSKRFPRYNKTTKFQSQKLENVGAALKFLKEEGIKLVAIGPEDVVEHRIKLILGLVWTIILRWQIQKIQDDGGRGDDAKSELIAWVNSVIPHNPVKNLKKDWQDGKALAALTNYLRDGSVDVTPEDLEDALSLVTKAVNAAEQEGVPPVISPEDIVSPDLDELSMMTYVAMFRDKDSQRRNADPSQFEAYGPGLKNPVVGKRNQFTVEARNSHGDRVHIGGLAVNSYFVPENSLDTVPSKVKDAKDGTYAVAYVPRNAGEYLVHVKVGETPIKNSPFRVNVRDPTPIDVAQSTVDPNISEKEDVHPRTYYTTVITRNAAGERITIGGAAIVANVLPHNGRDEIISVVDDKEDGTYEILFKQPPAGKYKVQVGLPDSGGEKVSQHVTNSPFNFGITADGEIESDVPIPAAENTTVDGDGVEKGKTDKPSAFTIHARDATGKSIPALPIHFVATLTDPEGNQTPIALNPQGDNLVGSYTPTIPGDYTVGVNVVAIGKAPETPVKSSPFTVPVKSSADASCTELSGPGITENDIPVTTGPSEFTIQSFDKNGNPLTEGGNDIDVTATSPDGKAVKLAVKDNGDGSYSAEYSPDAAGKHTISAKVDGKDVKNSPAEIEILDAPSGENTTVDGDGVEKGKTDKPSKFKVHTKNAQGKSIPANADLIKASVTDPSGNKTPVELTSDGNNLVGEYTPTAPGDYTVEVNVNDKGQEVPVKDSPFTVPVKASADASRSELSGPGITETDAPVTTGPSQFTIKSFDKAGNPLVEGGEEFDVSVKGPDGNSVTPDVKDNGDGTYTIEYSPEDAGEHTVSVKNDGQDVNNSPAVINIVDAPSADKTTVDGDGVEKGKTDKPNKFKIHAKDSKGKPIPANADLFKATVTDPSGNKSPIDLKPDGDDLVGEYTPSTPGDHVVEVNVNDKGTETPVKDSPFSVPVRVSASSSNSELSGPGITDKEAFVTTTEPSYFVIKTFDKEGNPLTQGGEEFEVSIKGPEGKVKPEVKDNGDGTYRVDYAPQEPGKHKISVSYDGDDVKNSPATIDVEEGTDEEATFAVDYMFTIEAKTKSGAPRTRGGDKFEVAITSKEGVEVEGVKVEDLAEEGQPGRYRVWYTLPGPGKYSVKATLNGKSIKGSPWKQSL